MSETKIGNFNVNTGGRVEAFNDRGTTQEVVYQEQPEPRYKQKDREMTQRARDYFGKGSNESTLERELWRQVTGKPEPKFNTALMNVEREVWRQSLIGDRSRQLSAELFNQINVR